MLGDRVIYKGEEMDWSQAAMEILKVMAVEAKGLGHPMPDAGQVLFAQLDALPKVT